MRVVEIGGHGNHRADECAAQTFFGAGFEGFEDFRRHFDGRFEAVAGVEFDHLAALAETVGQVVRLLRQIGQGAADQAFGRADGVERVGFLFGKGFVADTDLVV